MGLLVEPARGTSAGCPKHIWNPYAIITLEVGTLLPKASQHKVLDMPTLSERMKTASSAVMEKGLQSRTISTPLQFLLCFAKLMAPTAVMKTLGNTEHDGLHGTCKKSSSGEKLRKPGLHLRSARHSQEHGGRHEGRGLPKFPIHLVSCKGLQFSIASAELGEINEIQPCLQHELEQ